MRSSATSTSSSPALRFSCGVAGSGAGLFLAGMVEAAGAWAVSTGAVAITVASIAGVIAMEGREQPTRSPSRVPDRRLSRSV